jgi:phosphoglycerate dehydrogenase-like enzyme
MNSKTNRAALLVAMSLCAVAPVAAAAKGEPSTADPKAIELMQELGLTDAPVALRDEKGWHTPRKIVMSAVGYLGPIQATVPGVEIVSVKSPEEMAAAAGDADAILGGDYDVCDDRVLAAAKKVRWVGIYSAGIESCLGKKPLERPGLVVTNMRAVAGPVMAEHTIGLMFALSRSLEISVARQARGEGWSRNFTGSEPQALTGKTMLVVGLGGIGHEVAKRAHALGMTVIATRASSREAPSYVSRVGLSSDLPAMIGQADVVVSCLPLIPATTNLFDAKMFARMKKTAYFINVGRGGSVVTDDLAAALNDGTIAGAGLDVTEPEPLPTGHALWKAKNLIITPHMSAMSDLGQAPRMLLLREQMRRFVAGDKMFSVVDMKKGY